MRQPDTTPDDELRATLREVVPVPPTEAVDWTALQRRIVARALPLLSGRQSARTGVWQLLSGWAGRAIPLAAAAAAAVLLILRAGVPRNAGDGGTARTYPTVEEALAGELFDGSARLFVAGTTDDDVAHALLFYNDREP